MEDKPILYSYWRSSCSWRVRIALQIAGIDVEQKAVHLNTEEGEQRKPDYMDKNPMQQVPMFVTKGNRITQSMAIMEYIHDIKPEANLLPRDPLIKAKIRMICEIIISGIQPMQNQSVMKMYSQLQEAQLAWAKYWIEKGLVALEKELKNTAGTRCVGDSVSLADCCLVPQVYNAKYRFSVDMAQFPTISRINDSLEQLPEFQAAHPSSQPDCPE